MKRAMRGFIDPYGLGFVVVLIGAFYFDIQDSFEPRSGNDNTQQIKKSDQEINSEHKK